ncbi:MAG: hypothetical protein AAGC46_19980 [Solirubrobacteraceae bacterium]
MAADDWFRSTVWDDAAREAFAQGLAQQRPDDRGEPWRIQGLTLIESQDALTQAAGVALLEGLVDAAPDQRSIAGAHEHLGTYHQDRGEIDLAIEHYRRSVEAERGDGNHEWNCGLALAALLAADPTGRDDGEATALLDLAVDDGMVIAIQRAAQLRYLLARARVEGRGERADLAAAYAQGVMNMVPRGVREVGGVRAEMEAIAARGDGEAVSPIVEEYRDVDGTVRWVWELVSRLHDAPAPGTALPASSGRLFAACERELREAGFDTFALGNWSVSSVKAPADARRAAGILLAGSPSRTTLNCAPPSPMRSPIRDSERSRRVRCSTPTPSSTRRTSRTAPHP